MAATTTNAAAIANATRAQRPAWRRRAIARSWVRSDCIGGFFNLGEHPLSPLAWRGSG